MYTESVTIDWDDRKNEANQRKHGVSFEEAVTVLLNPLSLMAPNAHGSANRMEYLGHSDAGRVLYVVTVEQRSDRVRIISAEQQHRSRKGMKKGFNFSKAKRVGDRFKGTQPKVAISVRIDADVLAWLRAEGERRGLPYQTLLNSILKDAQEGGAEERLRKVIREELGKKAG